MRAVYLLAGAALTMTSVWAVAQDAPESLLPKMFEEPASQRSSAPRPAATPRPTPQRTAAPRPASTGTTAAAIPTAPPSVSTPVVQAIATGAPVVGTAAVTALASEQSNSALKRIPTLEELERMTPEAFEALLGSKVLSDMPPQARRSILEAGILGQEEGGLPLSSLASQNGRLIDVALAGNKGHLVSRWGHILLRRALVSRLQPPQGMSAQEFMALRVSLLMRMGEVEAARTLLQDFDIADYTPVMAPMLLDVYARTADFTGLCPIMATQGGLREDAEWGISRTICDAFRGNNVAALTKLERDRKRGALDQIDLLLAQKYAGAAGKSRRAVTIEWDKVKSLNPWRYGLAIGVGLEPPAGLMKSAGPSYDYITALAPMVGLARRGIAADRAAAAGVLSNSAMVDLYSQIYADADVTGELQERAELLRDAYTKEDSLSRLNAMQSLWNVKGVLGYGRQVLTAAAAARMAPSKDLSDSAHLLIASMLSGGYDGNAQRWSDVVEEGSRAWGLLAVGLANRGNVGSGSVDNYLGSDDSYEQRRTAFLAAGLAGLGRLDVGAADKFRGDSSAPLNSETRWTKAINSAAERGDTASVVLLAGFGMQGKDWQRMTPRYLYHIVSTLRTVGLEAEARMIAAEALARA